MRKMRQWLPSGILIALCAAALSPLAATADPVISGFNNDHVPLNAIVTIYGSDLGNAQGTGIVTVGDHRVPVLAWAPTAIHVLINPLAYNQAPIVLDAVYPVQVTRADAKKSNVLNLTITSAAPVVSSPTIVNPPTHTDQPAISGFQKGSFCPGNDIAIFGVGFGDTQGSGYVTIVVPFLDTHGNRTTQVYAIPVLNWTESAIDALLLLPPGAQKNTTYSLTVHRGNGKTASSSFLVGACP